MVGRVISLVALGAEEEVALARAEGEEPLVRMYLFVFVLLLPSLAEMEAGGHYDGRRPHNFAEDCRPGIRHGHVKIPPFKQQLKVAGTPCRWLSYSSAGFHDSIHPLLLRSYCMVPFNLHRFAIP